MSLCAITRRMLLMGMSMKTPAGAGATLGPGGAAAAAAGAALEGTKESMSFLMILPSGPVPEETHKYHICDSIPVDLQGQHCDPEKALSPSEQWLC